VKLRPYPAYKDSGLSWLGKIPAHWHERRAKYFFREVDERSGTGQEELLSVSHVTGVSPRSQKNVTMFMAESYVGHKLCQAGDLVINTMWAWMAALGVARQTGIVSPSYAVYRPIRSNLLLHDFVDHLLRTKPYVSEYMCRSTGIRSSRLRLYPEKFLDIPIICPSYEEQEQILAFLQMKDQAIRRFIRARRRMIELLNEQKQAVIHQAVTRGLDHNIRLKPSGIDWLREVPAHWTIHKLKYLTRFDNGLAFQPSDWRNSGVPIIRIQNLNGANDFNYTDREDLPQHLLIQPGELLFSWSGNRGTSFGPFLWNCPFAAYLNQHIFKLTGYSLDKKFFYYLLHTVTVHVEEQTHGIIGLVHITKPELGTIAVPVPPHEEQLAVAAHLDGVCTEIAAPVQRARREIDLIREYRTRLIADVVTGKLNVRDVELPKMDETAVLGDFNDSEDVADLAEEADEVEGIEEEDAG
jgi:type I restriction enzyme, S subunit